MIHLAQTTSLLASIVVAGSSSLGLVGQNDLSADASVEAQVEAQIETEATVDIETKGDVTTSAEAEVESESEAEGSVDVGTSIDMVDTDLETMLELGAFIGI